MYTFGYDWLTLKLKTIYKFFLCPYKRQSSMLCFIAFRFSRVTEVMLQVKCAIGKAILHKRIHLLVLSLHISLHDFSNFLLLEPFSHKYLSITCTFLLPVPFCYSHLSFTFISKFFNNFWRVYNKFIIITVTWSEMADHVSLTGADH